MRSYSPSASFLGFVPLLLLSASGCGSDGSRTSVEERLGSTQLALTQSCGQPDDGPVQGYDISEHQGANFDWNAAKTNDGISFGYARISYGTDHPDLTFDGNWARIKAAGLLRGAYQYFIPVQDVAEQAQIVIDAVGKLGVGDLPVQFDVEPVGWERGSLTPAQLVDRMHQWLDLVEAGTGKRPFIYTNAYLWQDAIQSADFGAYGLWIANYGPPSGCPLINDGWSKWTVWQYSDGGGKLDHNVFNGTLDELQGFAGAGTGSEPYPAIPRKSVADLDGDGRADVCARAAKGIVCALSSGTTYRPLFDGPAWNDDDGWLNPAVRDTIQFGDIDGDGKADLCARSTDGVVCKRFDGTGFTADIAGPAWSDEAGWDQPSRYSTVQLADVNGDGKQDICGRTASAFVCHLAEGSGFGSEMPGPAWSDAAGWNRADQYGTIQLADIDGDAKADACARDAEGIVCYLSNGNGFPTAVRGPAWSNAAGWSKAQYGSTIRFVDVDGDGRADVCGRGPAGLVCAISFGTTFGPEIVGPAWTDAAGWDKPSSYRTIVWGDLDGDAKADVCGRTATGMVCFRSLGNRFSDAITGPAFADDSGWSGAEYFTTIAFGDIDHDGKDDLCGRGPDGMTCAPSNGNGFGAPIIATADWSDDKGWRKLPYYSSIRVIGTTPMAKYDPSKAQDGGSTHDGPGTPTGLNPTDAESGCGCRTAPARTSWAGGYAAAFALGLVVRRRRRAR